MSTSGLSGVSGVSGLSIGGGVVLPGPLTFATATGISDTRILGAVAWLESALKSNGTWSLYRAIYPFVGGTPDTHKWNIRDLRDEDAAFRMTFGGSGITHTADGMVGSANGWGDTKISAPVNGLGFYTASDVVANDYGIGHLNGGSTSKREMIHPRWSGGTTIMDPSPSTRIQFNSTGPIGHVAYSYSPSVDCFAVRNGTVPAVRSPIPTEALMTTTDIPGTIHVGAVNGIASRSLRTFALATVSDFLTQAQAIADSLVFIRFQAMLGRHADPWTIGGDRLTTATFEDWY